MTITLPAFVHSRRAQLKIVGGLGAITIAAVVYSQFSIYGWLKRDSGIYMYGGQQMTHGVPPYASIMDPKGPLASVVCGVGEAVARLFGRNDVIVMRVEFCAIAILTVLGVYLLVLEMWDSVVAALVAAAVFTSFKGFARDALAGPNGHTPGILFLVLGLWLTARKQWYWAGFATGLAFLDWQPLFPYAIVAVICAVAWSAGRRLQAAGWCVAGGATPMLAFMLYYAAEGEIGKLFEGLFLFPLTGVYRPPKTLGQRIHAVVWDVHHGYGASGYLLWIGLALLLAAAIGTVVLARVEWRQALLSPMVLLVMLSLLAQVVYAVYDYAGYSHAYPLLPYAAMGFGAATAYALRSFGQPRIRQAGIALALACVIGMTAAFSAIYYQRDLAMPPLRGEQASACVIKRALVPGTVLWTLGNPLPLVLLHLRNPDNYPYLGSGLDKWKIKHTRGGFDGWTGQIVASGASIVVLNVWKSPVRPRMEHWLASHGYIRGYIGPWKLYVTAQARARMRVQHIALPKFGGFWPRSTDHTLLTQTRCT